MIRERLHAAVKEALIDLGAPEAEFVVERPGSMAHGDYATNAALAAAKMLKQNPREVAEEIVKRLKFSTLLGAISKTEIAGAGFINFSLSREALTQEVMNAQGEGWGSNTRNAGKQVLVEYTSPNLFKPLHIGNLIGNILGESIARLFEHSGAEVKRVNYPSDIGLTVAKGVWGLLKTGGDSSDIQALGEAYRVGNAAYEDESAKSEIEEINRALYEDSNPQWSELRRAGIETSRKHLLLICQVLGTTFDKEFFESQSGPVGKEIVREHVGSVFEESDGAVIYRGEQDGLHTRVFLNSQGLPTYEAKEVGLYALKSEAYPTFDVSITVTGGEQTDFFKVVFAAIKKVFKEQTDGVVLRHIPTSFLRLTTGKMSSRKGNVITGESLIEDLKKSSREKMQDRDLTNAPEIAEQVAVGAIKYAVLKQGSGKDIVFDPEKSLSLEGDSGPYLQYAHTRALSLAKAATKADINPDSTDAPSEPTELERLLVHFPDVLEHAARELEPHFVTTYLTELASAFNSWYASTRVIGGEYPSYGLLLAKAVEKTLAKGLQVLGIPAPEEM